MYEDKTLLERARKLIPINQLESQAQVKLRQLQEALKKRMFLPKIFFSSTCFEL